MAKLHEARLLRAGIWHPAHLVSFVVFCDVVCKCHMASGMLPVVEAAGLLAAGVPGTAGPLALHILHLTDACMRLQGQVLHEAKHTI